jgi:squalene-hopene/tetraprenyl-beta-curcumene cyclase
MASTTEFRHQAKQRTVLFETDPEHSLRARVARAIDGATEFLFSAQRHEGYWCSELESNVTITAEYVFMCRMLALEDDLTERRLGLTTYLLGKQNIDGSWAIARGTDGDISTTAEAYLALRILGLGPQHEALLGAERFILRHGGLEQLRVFTRIAFAMFGLLPWRSIPAIPPEFILLPAISPVNPFALSSWARCTMIPLFIICHHRPVYELREIDSCEDISLDHLWLNSTHKKATVQPPWLSVILQNGASTKSLFTTADVFLKLYEKIHIRSLRTKALKACTRYVVERQEESGDWAGIFPPMLNGVMALSLQGYELHSPEIRRGLAAIHRFSWEDENGLRIQACVSPVWDTVLATIGAVDCGISDHESRDRVENAMNWVAARQITREHGDWKIYRPHLPSGGWSFEYHNSWYPDIDDTAAVILAFLKLNPDWAESATIDRAVSWILGMQNRDGGWAAFDVDNDKEHLNDIPFSDMQSLCDPSTPDVTGRVIEALGCVLQHVPQRREEITAASARAIKYLRRTQELPGSWFGRWGVNYIYGTSNVLCGLASLQGAMIAKTDPMIEHALRWIQHVQGIDGGWGESVASYADKRWMGRGESTPSQTAWALMALLAYLPPQHPAIQRGVEWLLKHQELAPQVPAYEGGAPVPTPHGRTWREEQFTGTGFPNHFYLRYHLYRHYFPMMALGRFAKACRA